MTRLRGDAGSSATFSPSPRRSATGGQGPCSVPVIETAGISRTGHLLASGTSDRPPVRYHPHNMRTTIEIPDHLLVEAKQLAAERHLPLTRLFEDSLRLYLGEQRLRRAQTEPAPLPLLRDPMPVAGINLDDTSSLWEIG